MNIASQSIVEQASQLTANEKIELIDALLATVDKPDAEIDMQWAREAEDRFSAYKRGEIATLDLNQILEKYR